MSTRVDRCELCGGELVLSREDEWCRVYRCLGCGGFDAEVKVEEEDA